VGHFVTGLVAAERLLQKFAARHRLHQPISLSQGLALLPLRDEDIDGFIPPPHSGHADGFIYLSQQLAAASEFGRVLYFETEYFGGTGAQGAVVYEQRECIFGPESADLGPINRALALLGVRTLPPACDEFETIGLHRHRSCEDWLETAED
jgi:hypothetical protein